MARLQLRNVVKSYGIHEAVRGVSLDIDDKEFVVFVGPSGCGKSTTLRMIAGLEHISRGEIAIGDEVVNRLGPGKRDIAMVFQNYALYPHMSVRENIAFCLEQQKLPKAEIQQRIATAAETLHITDCSTVALGSFQVANVSAWQWAGRSCEIRRSSCSTSRSPTWMQNCE